MLRDMFKKTYTRIERAYASSSNIPDGMWRKCTKCAEPIYVEDVRTNHYVCPKCQGYFRVHAYRRIEMLADKGSFIEWNKHMPLSNPLDFPGYEQKLAQVKEKAKLDEAVVTGELSIEGVRTAIAVCDSRFLMSSMGHVVGEKITYAIEMAAKEQIPMIIFACSGGARMQEGIISLMQMAKTSAALKRLHDAGQVFISVLTDPTTGGVTASFAMLGDIILAEPKALIGFAGPRVIAQTIGTKLPEGFQRSEFLLEHGFIDAIVERKDQKEVLHKLLLAHTTLASCTDLPSYSAFVPEINKDSLPKEIWNDQDVKSALLKPTGEKHSAWESVEISRDALRPTSKDYIDALFPDFIELHGDRLSFDDGAIIGGIASFRGTYVTVIAQQKGRGIKENKTRNFGMPKPSGYRKALRLMKQAAHFKRPVICLVDTPGAFCGIEAEEDGQGEAIARNLYEMSALPTPILSIVIGEGGSGGALAMAVADEVWMLENSIYSILSPEGFASILYKDAKRSKEAAQVMKITSSELYKLGIIERVIAEKTPLKVADMGEVLESLRREIQIFLQKMMTIDTDTLLENRYQRFRKF